MSSSLYPREATAGGAFGAKHGEGAQQPADPSAVTKPGGLGVSTRSGAGGGLASGVSRRALGDITNARGGGGQLAGAKGGLGKATHKTGGFGLAGEAPSAVVYQQRATGAIPTTRAAAAAAAAAQAEHDVEDMDLIQEVDEIDMHIEEPETDVKSAAGAGAGAAGAMVRVCDVTCCACVRVLRLGCTWMVWMMCVRMSRRTF